KHELGLLREKLEKIHSRDAIKSKLELLNDQKAIENQYRSLQQKHEQLAGKKDTDIREKMFREQLKLVREGGGLRNISSRVIQICDSLVPYGIKLSTERILKDDLSE